VPEPVPEPETVTQLLPDEAVQLQVDWVVTLIEPDTPAAGAEINEGVSVKVQDVPASVTLNVLPAIVRVAALDRVLGFATTLNVTVPDPLPVAPLEIVTQAALLDAVQLQPADVVTVTVPVPPPTGKA
jgi:hypothetical protein